MDIVWYSSGINSSCDIIGNNLNKFSKNKYIKTRWNEVPPVKDIFIGSYRYFDDDLTYYALLKDYDQENLFIYAHGISKEESKDFKIFTDNWQERDIKCQKILVSCNYSQNLFKKANIDTDILPFGVNIQLFHPESKPISSKIIYGMVFAQGKGHRKGQEFAMNLIRTKDVNIQFAHFGHTEMPKFYNSIDCLLVLSEEDGRETFCLPILEAGACAIPVFSTKVGVGNQLIKPDINGYLGTKEQIVEAIKNVSLKELLRMGTALHQEVFMNWAWDKIIDIWDDYFK